MTTLIWFQRDLRLQDNSALRHAMLENGDLIAVYIHSPQEDAPWSEGAASRWWLHQSLRKLHDDLRQINIELQFFQGKSRELIPELVDFYNATTVTWTGRHEPQRRVLEQTISNHLQQDGIHVNIFRDELLSQPDQFFTKTAQSPYRVFTPFYKRLRAELSLEAQEPSASPLTTRSLTTIERHVRSLTLDQLQLLNGNTWHEKLHRYWIPGERTAIEKLERFIDNSMASYPTDRDYPALNGTSGLSPHLHFGEISPTQLLDALVPLIEFGDAELSLAAEVFLRQLIWREFARYILLHFPETATEPMNKRFTPGFW
ncbi:MAG: deoxyribodipyrimidine photo-lyase, partial [Gammaproteobacteria bacterium]|nr:deoxyribodipyrimidine photo-lyase [Gammaproteobacteria bacterium]